jgi:hypothetical protein
MSRSVLTALILAVLNGSSADAQQAGFPIIDMHFHGALEFNEQKVQSITPWLEAFDRRGVKKAVLTSYPHQLKVWAPSDPERLIPSLWFPCVTQFVRHCFPGDAVLPEIKWLRGEIEAGRIAMIGEVGTELVGIFPNDPALEPYFSLAEELDIPFALHMGPGPAWAVGRQSIYEAFPDFQIRAGDPLELENVLRRHPRLRLYIMHAAWPMLDELLTILWHNPNVYVDLGHLQIAIPRAEYYSYLRRIVEAGYADRIMYGSDVGLDDFGSGIDAIMDADFLSEEQRRNILYNNAARFLRLSKEEIARHHGR